MYYTVIRYIDGSWSVIPAYLPLGILTAATVTLSNQVYLFGKRSLEATLLENYF